MMKLNSIFQKDLKAQDIHFHSWLAKEIKTKKEFIKISSKKNKKEELLLDIYTKQLNYINKNYENSRNYSFKDSKIFKTEIKNIEKILVTKILIKKDINNLEKKNIRLNKLKNKLKNKSIHNYINNKIEINKSKKWDQEKLYKVDSLTRKLYLKDEPPLSPAGWIKLLLSYAIIIFWTAIIIWPVYELVKATFNIADTQQLSTKRFEFGLGNFQYLFGHTNYKKWLVNTVIIAIFTSMLTILTTLLIAYAYSRFRFKGKKSSLMIIMLLQMIPAFAALTVFYVIYTILKQKYNISGNVVLIIIYVGGGIAGNTFIMKGYMNSISTDIDEAAKIDGLSQFKIFTRIIVPLTKPMIAIIGLWSFIGPFGDILLPSLLFSDNANYTIATGLRELVVNKRDLHQPAYAAGAIIVALPISVAFILLRKFLVGGLIQGGVKG